LKIIPVSGGVAKILCGGTWIGGAVWRNDNTIIYGNDTTGIMRISADGGTPETLIEEKNYGGLFFPQLLPDGKSVLFNQHQSDRQSRIMVQSLQSDEPKDLGEGTAARYLPTGHIVYSSENSLFAVPFDIDSLEPTGIPIPIVEGVQYYQYAISESGTLIYKPGKSGDVVQKSNLVWVDRKGNEESIDAPLDLYSYPKISFDETRIVLTIGMRGYEDLWVWDINRKALSMLTSDEIGVGSSVWTPDSQRIIFSSNTQGTTNDIYWMAANGTGEIELLVAGQGDRLAAVSMPRDGSTLLMGKWGGGVRNDIESYLMEGEGERKPLLQEKYSEVNPQISPDGRWLAYMSNESGQYEVYVRSFPDVDGVKKQASTDGGFSPLWSPDSSELFFRNGNSVLAVKVKTEPNLELGAPEVLFNGTYSSLITPLATASNMWDIHPDGSRFLMMKPVGTAEEESAEESAVEEPRKINIILNWFEELKQKVPVP